VQRECISWLAHFDPLQHEKLTGLFTESASFRRGLAANGGPKACCGSPPIPRMQRSLIVGDGLQVAGPIPVR
jgi:hypothetical protein